MVSKGKKIKLYVLTNISEQSKFETRTRKEISEIKWFNVSSLPAMSVSNRAFADKLQAFCKQNAPGSGSGSAASSPIIIPTTGSGSGSGKAEKKSSAGISTPPRKQRRKPSDGAAATSGSAPLSAPALNRTKSATASSSSKLDPLGAGGAQGWSAEQMFATNESRFGVSADAVVEELVITPEVEAQLKKFFSAKQIAQLKAKQNKRCHHSLPQPLAWPATES